MPAAASRVCGTLLLVMILASPVSAWFATGSGLARTVSSELLAVQAGLITWYVLTPGFNAAVRIGASALAFLGAVAIAFFMPIDTRVSAAVPHAAAYLALLTLFGRSLRPGREPIITVLAHRSRGFLSPAVQRYTRRITWMWCWFFLAQLVGSSVLLALASPRVWSLCVILGNLPLVGAMLCGEYVYRQLRHPADPPERLHDMVRIVRALPIVPAQESR